MQSSGVASHRADKSRGMRQSEGFLKKIDLFASTPEILYRGSTSCGSNFGGLVTLIWGTLYLLVTFFVTWRYIDRGQPQSNSSNFYMKDPEGFRLDNDTLPFALGLQNSSGLHFIDPRIYNITATYVRISKTTNAQGDLMLNRTRIVLSLIPCNQLSLDQSAFANLDLSSMLCLENLKTKQHDLQITGLFESSIFGYVYFSISKCKGPTCASNQEIDARLKSSYFAVNYRTFEMRTSEFNDPIAPIPASFYTATSTTFSKQVTLRMANNQLVTENSFIPYATPDTKSYPSVSRSVNELSGVYDSIDKQDTIVTLNIRMDPTLIVTQRSYRSLYQYIAEFGGLSQILAALGFLLTNRYRHLFLKFDFARYVLNRAPHLRNPFYLPSFGSGAGKSELRGLNQPELSQSKGIFSQQPAKGSSPTRKLILNANQVTSAKVHPLSQKQDQEPKTRDLPSEPNSHSSREQISNVPPLETELGRYDSIQGEVVESSPRNILQNPPQTSTLQPKSTFATLAQNLNDSSPSVRKTPRKVGFSNILGFGSKSAAGGPPPGIEHAKKLQGSRQSLSDFVRETSKTLSVSTEKLQKDRLIKQGLSKISELELLWYSLFPTCLSEDKANCLQSLDSMQTFETFDLLEVVASLADVKKLKRILLTPEQLVLFDMIPASHMVEHSESSMKGAFQSGLQVNSKPQSRRFDFFTDHQDVQENARFSMCLEKINQKPTLCNVDLNLLSFFGRIEGR